MTTERREGNRRGVEGAGEVGEVTWRGDHDRREGVAGRGEVGDRRGGRGGVKGDRLSTVWGVGGSEKTDFADFGVDYCSLRSARIHWRWRWWNPRGAVLGFRVQSGIVMSCPV